MESRERDKVSGLTFEIQFGKPVAVFIQSSKIKQCIAYMKEHTLENVIINSELKYTLPHLDFLKENSFISSVEIETDIADCSALNTLHDLKSFVNVLFINHKYNKIISTVQPFCNFS